MLSTTDLWVLGLILVTFATLLLSGTKHIPKGLRLPPGPSRKPFVGNISDMPTHREWEVFSRWAKTYGDIIYLKVLGQPMVIINSLELAHELFEKRSSIYSDRGESPMLNDLMGLSWAMGFMRYGDEWRQQRRLAHLKLNPNIVHEYHGVQTKHARNLLRLFHESPKDFVTHIRHAAGAIIMEVTYGIKVLPKDDPYIIAADNAAKGIAAAGTPGAFLVDTLPILKYVPEWLPGTNYLQKAKEWRKHITDTREMPFHAVKKAMDSGIAEPSIVLSLLEGITAQGETASTEESAIQSVAGAFYSAGSDTVVTSITTFILTMVLFPEVQRKAQMELDEALGPDRLPDFSDRENLPYINATCKEVLRWQPVAPLGVPHKLTKDDIVGEYFIPAGTMVFGNAWYILHDETVYGPETEKFKPERFLDHDMKNVNAAFGFGRRICPGKYMAENSLFIAIASILKVFDISPLIDGKGRPTLPDAEFTSGFLSIPLPFQCSIKTRSDTARKLILDIGELL